MNYYCIIRKRKIVIRKAFVGMGSEVEGRVNTITQCSKANWLHHGSNTELSGTDISLYNV